MKQKINESEFIDAFDKMNRGNNFTYEGRRALYKYLTQFEEDTNEEIDLDVIALCCDYHEYKDLNEYLNNYLNQHEEKQEDETGKDFKERIEKEINDNTTLIKIGEDLDEGFIIQAY